VTIRVLSVGLLAGLIAGLLVSAIQQFTTTPLILAAEQFETASAHSAAFRARDAAESDGARLILVHADHPAEGGQEAWQPADGLERTFYTSIATVATAIGFALLLLGGLLFSDGNIDASRALNWAAAGFVVTGLAPALGLAPELPGMQAAGLVERQAWWIGTAAATAVALWLFFQTSATWLKAAAVVLLAAPHIIGAPHPHHLDASQVPAELAARFAAASLVTHAILWALTGWVLGWLWQLGENSRRPV
jgi:cobalt transporter subunit CbtA